MIGIKLGMNLGSNVPTLLQQALSAIRRLGGTALYVPDDYGLVLGPELVTNGGPFTATTGWAPFNGAAITTASGSLRITNGNYGGATFVTAATVGKQYRVRVVRSGGTATGYRGTLLGVVTTLNAGETSVAITATDNQTTAFVNSATAGETLEISSYSVREIISATTFIDSTGTQPVTAVGDLVGRLASQTSAEIATQPTTASKPLVTRVPKKLGPNLVVNGGFGTDTSWTKSGGATISGGVANLPISVGIVEQGVATSAGKTYWVTASSPGGTYCGAWDAPGQTNVLSGSGAGRSGTFTFQFTANDALSYVVFGATGGGATTVDDVVVSEVLEWSNALDFDGSNDLLTLSSGAILQQGSDHFVTAAFVLDAVGAEQAIYGTANASGASSVVAYMAVAPSGKVQGIWVSDASAVVVIESLSAISTGTPYVATIRKVGGTFSLFLNGVLQATSTTVLGATNVNAAAIGALARSPSGYYLNGKVPDIALGQSTLTEADRKTIERNMANRAGVTYVG